MAGLETPVPLLQRTPAAAATTAPTAAQAAAAPRVAAAAPRVGLTELMALAASSEDEDDFNLPEYAAAAAHTQAARSEDEDNAAYRRRHVRSPNSEVGDYLDIEAKQSSRSRVQVEDAEESNEEPDEKVPDDKESDDEESDDP